MNRVRIVVASLLICLAASFTGCANQTPTASTQPSVGELQRTVQRQQILLDLRESYATAERLLVDAHAAGVISSAQLKALLPYRTTARAALETAAASLNDDSWSAALKAAQNALNDFATRRAALTK